MSVPDYRIFFRAKTDRSVLEQHRREVMLNQPILEKELESTAYIRFQDCDPFQHLNNARYVDYFMNAREDQLAKFYNFHIFEVARQTGQGWVVSKSQLAYLAPAIMQEQVLIRTHLIQMTDTVLVVEGLMFDEDARRLKSVAWIEFTFISLQTGRTTKQPDASITLFRPVVVPGIYSPDGFTQRVTELKTQFRRQLMPEA
jgi:acyl-CoA thioester hydrolase